MVLYDSETGNTARMAEHVARDEMFRAFNMGVGMVLVVRPDDVNAVLDATDGYLIGEIETGEKEARIV